jgi:peptidyl-Lys metalloendopeptidase
MGSNMTRAAWFGLIGSTTLMTMHHAIANAQSASPDWMNDLRCELRVPEMVSPRQRVFVTTELRNVGKKPILVLRRNTPLEEMGSDVFQVEANEQAKEYNGPMAKRAAPSKEEFVVLKPGAGISYRVDLQRGYDVGAPGEYFVSWSGTLMHASLGTKIPDGGSLETHKIACEPVHFERTAQ